MPLPSSRTIPISPLHQRHTSNNLDLRNPMAVSQDCANLTRSRAFPGEFADLVNDLVRCDFEPCGRLAAVRDSRGGNAFTTGVETTHVVLLLEM